MDKEIKYENGCFYVSDKEAFVLYAKSLGFDRLSDSTWGTYCPYKLFPFLNKPFMSAQAKEALVAARNRVLDSLCPDKDKVMAKKYPFLRAYQTSGVRRLVVEGNHLLADQPGLGKTVQAIAACDYINAERVLIICLATLMGNWKKEIYMWLGNRQTVRELQSPKDVKKPLTERFTIINYDKAHIARYNSFLRESGKFDVLIMDECHYLKNLNAQRTKSILSSEGLYANCKKVIAISGTPMMAKSCDLYPVLRAVCPLSIYPYTQYEAFLNQFNQWFRDSYGTIVVTANKNLDELNFRLRSTCMTRRMKKDVLKDLPDKQYQVVKFAAASSGYLAEEAEAFSQVTSVSASRISDFTRGNPKKAVRLRSLLSKEKKHFALNYIEDMLFDGVNKLVVFASYTETLDYLQNKLKSFGVVRICGGTPMAKRSKIVDSFQNNKDIRVFLGQEKAASEGITLTAASDVVFVDIPWQPTVLEQASDRCHRIGQKSNVLVRLLVAEDTIDEAIVNALEKKENDVQRATN
jgi:SWI/SNF-related matrix-associated actin-dependent regulator 1 of chromatin subfamily A